MPVALAPLQGTEPPAVVQLAEPARLDASKLVVKLATELKPIPCTSQLRFAHTMTDHLLVVSYDPIGGWSAPEIRPYGPLPFDPASSCLQYATTAFEGMKKAYIGPDGEARLFRPEKNMARLARSAVRVALPRFDIDELLKLIRAFVKVENRWIPTQRGHSLYIRPMIVGTRASMGLSPSNSALLWVMCAPSGPFFPGGMRPLSLLAVSEATRAWPGGTGEHKVAGNYGPTLAPQEMALSRGYDQTLWLFNGKITEAGVMNFFVALRRDDGDVDLLTPPLDGTILPGVTRESILALAAAHPARIILPDLPPSLHLHASERVLTMSELQAWQADGRILEIFSVGTAVIVAPIGRIGYEGKDIELPTFESGLGPIGRALYRRITDIQDGRYEWEGWSVVCE
ncbi:branched-chain amino acid aminotransferase II [Pilatotrama ljubarskyi]|nr:branched-chain amino acid aminotransferase II [Pilatotrama ljubarskyi]